MARSTAVASGPLASGSTTTLTTGRSLLNNISVTTDGVNAATVTVYDNTAGSGRVIAVLAVIGATLYGRQDYSISVRVDIGLTIVVAGTGATAYVTWGGA